MAHRTISHLYPFINLCRFSLLKAFHLMTIQWNSMETLFEQRIFDVYSAHSISHFTDLFQSHHIATSVISYTIYTFVIVVWGHRVSMNINRFLYTIFIPSSLLFIYLISYNCRFNWLINNI